MFELSLFSLHDISRSSLIILIIYFFLTDIPACNVSSDGIPVMRPLYVNMHIVIFKYNEKKTEQQYEKQMALTTRKVDQL